MTRSITLFLAILLVGLPALPVMAEDSDIVVEVVTFKSVAGTSSERLVAAAAGVRSFMEEQKGYLGRQLLETEDGIWIDIVRWADVRSATNAAQLAQHSDICLLFFSMIDPPTMSVYHGAVRLTQ